MERLSPDWHLPLLIIGSVAGFFATVFLSGYFFPEHWCVSLRGIYWCLVYILFFVITALRMGSRKNITFWILLRNFLASAVAPYLMFLLITIL